MTTIPDHVGREAVRLLNAEGASWLAWPGHTPPPDEEAAKRVIGSWFQCDPNGVFDHICLARATEQMRKEREAWEAGR